MKTRVQPVACLLFLSGLCALVFQVTWFREFRLVFGASTGASAAVLAIFMGGLGLGSAVLGRRADRYARPLAYYAVLELLVGLTAAASPLLVDLARASYVALGGQLALGFTGATAVRLALAAMVLGVPTLLMGGTLPAAARAVTTAADENRRETAILYAANTAGAVAGALLSTLLVIELLGNRWSLWSAAAVNVGTALAAYLLSRRGVGQLWPVSRPSHGESAWSGDRPKRPRATSKARDADPDRPIPAAGVYFGAAVVGFVFFLMELVWYRMLGPVLGGSTFTFGLILAVALAGIGVGGAIYPIVFRRRRPSLQWFALTCALEVLCIAVPYAVGDSIAVWAARLQDANQAGFRGEVTNWIVVAGAVIFPAALVAGLQYPLLIALVGRGEKDLGRQIGLVAAWNTLGAIAGSLAGGFGLLPALSAPGVWRAAVVLLLALSVLAMLQSWRLEGRSRVLLVPLAAAAAAAVGLGFEGPTAVWRHSAIGAGRARVPTAESNEFINWQHEQRRRTVWEADGLESSVAIARNHGLAFLTNGKSDGSAIGDAGTQIMLGLVAGILHPAPKRIFVVGLGTGETAGWLAAMPAAERVDVVELEPAVDEMARRCAALNHDVLRHPKVRRIYNDAREVLLTVPERYDLIVSEPLNPYRSGVAGLFTREYYLAGRQRLNEGGLFAQWVQGYEVDAPTMRTVCATLRSVYPNVEIWQLSNVDLLLLASVDPIRYPVAELRRRAAAEPFRSALACAWRTNDLEGMLAHYLGGPALVREFLGSGPVPLNTDDRNVIEYGFARTAGRLGGFSPVDLRKLAAATTTNRPPVEGGPVDWDGVTCQWLAMYAAHGRGMPADASLATDQQVRRQALSRLAAEDWKSGVQLWRSQARPAGYPTELALLGRAYAELGDAAALPLIEALRSFQPTEAEALRGILLWRQRKPAEAAAALAGAFRRLRSDPWPSMELMSRAMTAAVMLAEFNPGLRAELLESLEEPFAAEYADEPRRRCACLIASMLSHTAAVHLVESFEPHVPWSRVFLQLRQRQYAAVNHPLAAQAALDLADFTHRATGAADK